MSASRGCPARGLPGLGTLPVVPLNAKDLALIDNTKEVSIETRSGDRVYRTVIWVVVDDESVYVRSFLGAEGKWYQRAVADPNVALDVDGSRIEFTAVSATDPASVEATSEGFRRKYKKGRSLDAMLVPEIFDTTLRLDPIT